MLKKHCTEIHVVASVDTVESAIQALYKYPVSIAFLDIELPDGKGYDILRYQIASKLRVIFITAHPEYAFDMYTYNPVTFLKKTLEPCQIIDAVNKATSQIKAEKYIERGRNLNSCDTIITLNHAQKINCVRAGDIVYCKSDSNYTGIYIKEKSNIIICSTLRDFHEKYPFPFFERVHKSYLINIFHIKCIDKIHNRVTLTDYDNISVTKSKIQDILKKLDELNTLTQSNSQMNMNSFVH